MARKHKTCGNIMGRIFGKIPLYPIDLGLMVYTEAVTVKIQEILHWG